MGKSTISMAIFNSYVKLPEGTYNYTMIHINEFNLHINKIFAEMMKLPEIHNSWKSWNTLRASRSPWNSSSDLSAPLPGRPWMCAACSAWPWPFSRASWSTGCLWQLPVFATASSSMATSSSAASRSQQGWHKTWFFSGLLPWVWVIVFLWFQHQDRSRFVKPIWELLGSMSWKAGQERPPQSASIRNLQVGDVLGRTMTGPLAKRIGPARLWILVLLHLGSGTVRFVTCWVELL